MAEQPGENEPLDVDEFCPCGGVLAPCPTCGDEWCAICEGNECEQPKAGGTIPTFRPGQGGLPTVLAGPLDPSAALAAILDLHAKGFDGYLHADICTHCSDAEDGRWAKWPCRTVEVVMAALSGRNERDQ